MIGAIMDAHALFPALGEQASKRTGEQSLRKVSGKSAESVRKVSGKSEDSLRKVSGRFQERFRKV